MKCLSLGGVAILVATGAYAQSTAGVSAPDAAIEEIVVTALKTGALSLEKVPEAVSVVSGSTLQSQGLMNIKDLAPMIPNLSVTQNTASASIYIRGIGSNNVSVGSDPDVTTQIDGIYIARPSGQVTDFLDVASIEVLRGPQGTLYGRNAVGGTININSQQPSQDFHAALEVAGGTYDMGQVAGYVSGRVADTLFGSIAFNYLRHDDYWKNVVLGQPNIDDANRGGVRAQLRWEPNSDFDATTRVDAQLSQESMQSYAHTLYPTRAANLAPVANATIGNSAGIVALNNPQPLRTTVGGIAEELNWRFATDYSLKSLTAVRYNQYQYGDDTDSTERFISDLASKETDRQVSQELNLKYQGERFSGVSGLYYFYDEDNQTQFVAVPTSGIAITALPNVNSTSAAAFAQGTYNFTSQFSAVVGARYTWEQKVFDQFANQQVINPATLAPIVSTPGFPARFDLTGNYHSITPKAGLNFQLTPDALLYISATKGYKSGGFNYAATTIAAASFKPESIWSYEAGAKTEWLDRRLQLNASVFYYDYSNLQVQQLLGPGVASIGNAATATARGAELETIVKPFAPLTLTANISVLDARYDQFNAASVPGGLVGLVPGEACTFPPRGAPICTNNASGHYLTNAPKFSGFVGVDYVLPIAAYSVTSHVDFSARSQAYFDPSNVVILSQGYYGVLNSYIRLAQSESHWSIDLFGKNLANRVYYINEAASGVTPDGVEAAPRTFGVRLLKTW